MLLIWGASLATAGCVAWSEEDEARLGEAGIVVAGTVRDLAVSRTTVRQHVEIDRAWKGHVRSGWLTLVSRMSGSTCPGEAIWSVGDRVYVVADPEPNGEVPVSPCVPSVGTFDGSTSRLVGLATRRPSTARRVDGSAPPPPAGPLVPFPEPGSAQARVVRAGVFDLGGELYSGDSAAVALEGAVLAERDGRIHGIWETDTLRVVGWVEAADVETVPIRTVSLAPGVKVAPGTSLLLDGATATYDAAGVRVTGTLPPDALGRVWRPEPVAERRGEVWVRRDVDWTAVPDGPPIGRLTTTGGYALTPTGDVVSGQLPVHIAAPGLSADGWIPNHALRNDGLGEAGGIAGGTYDGSPTIELPAGTDVAALEVDVVFARTTEPLSVRLLAEAGDRIWVIVPTPWGPIGGEVVRSPER